MLSTESNSCDNCGIDTENEPLTLCDDCNTEPASTAVDLRARIAELEAALATRDDVLELLAHDELEVARERAMAIRAAAREVSK